MTATDLLRDHKLALENCVAGIAEHEAKRAAWLAEIERAGGMMAYLGLTENRLDVPPIPDSNIMGLPRW